MCKGSRAASSANSCNKKREEAARVEFRRKREQIERESTHPTSLFPRSYFAISIIWTPGSRSKEKGESGDCSFFFLPTVPTVCLCFVFVVIISSTLLLMSNVKSLTTTSSDEDPTYRLTQYLQVPISTHIGPAIQRISSSW